MADVSWDFSTASSRPQSDLGVVIEVLRGDIVRRELECSDVPSQHLWRQLGFNMTEQKRDADAPVSNPAIEGIPPGDLGSVLEDIGKFQGHHP